MTFKTNFKITKKKKNTLSVGLFGCLALGQRTPQLLLIVVNQSRGLRYRTRTSARRWKREPVCTIHRIGRLGYYLRAERALMGAIIPPIIPP